MAVDPGQIGSSLNPMNIIGQSVQPGAQPGAQPWMKEYTQPSGGSQGGWGAPGQGGAGLGQGNYASYKSGGFGMMPSGAGPLAEGAVASTPDFFVLRWHDGDTHGFEWAIERPNYWRADGQWVGGPTGGLTD